jgi:hypothetical protein
VSITELDQGSLGRYILQSGRDATGSLRRSGCRSRSCGSHPCSILRLLAVVRRLTVRARRGRELGRSPREGQRTRCGKGLGLSRVGRMRLNTLHDEGYVVAQRSVCGQPSRSSRGRKTSQCLPYKLMLARSSLRCSGRGVANNKAESYSDRGGRLEKSGRNNLGDSGFAHENGRNLLHFKNQRVFIRDYAARRTRGWQRRRQRGGSGIFFLFCDRFRRRRSVNGRALREMGKYQATMRAEGTCSSSSAAQCRWGRSKQMRFSFSGDLALQFQLQLISFQKPSSLATRGSGDFRVCFGEKIGEKRRMKD